jgi:superfamily II DNA or RNA helicase
MSHHSPQAPDCDVQLGQRQESSGLEFIPIAPARRLFIQRAVCDGRRMGLVTPFVDGIGDFMRELGAAWSPLRRMWVCEVSAMRTLLDGLIAGAGRWPTMSIDDARQMALAAWQEPTPDFFVSLLDVQLLPLTGGGFALTSAFDALVVRAVKSLGGRFHKPAGAWELRADAKTIEEALARIAGVTADLVFLHEGQVLLEKLAAPTASSTPISVPGAAPMFAVGVSADHGEASGSSFLSAMGAALEAMPINEAALAAAANDCGLRDYQVAGVRHLLGHSSALLADDMGLGKTRQAVVAGRLAAGPALVLVTCPASLGINWAREIRAVYPNARIATVGENTMAEVAASDWVIASYERLGGLVRATDLNIGVLIVDEAHYLKEHKAGRTRNAFLLSQRVPRRFLLTGTPVLNREIELHTLLRLSGHPLGVLPLVEFRKLYAGDSARRDELAGHLSRWMLRRGKDVLKGLGSKTEQVRYVQAADGLAGYRHILGDPTLQGLAKITKLRQHLEALKVEFLIETVQCLPADAKVLIFCDFVETVESLKQAFKALDVGCVSLVGSDAPKKRMAAVDGLQHDKAVRVFVGTTSAAGVGINLTAANYVLFASEPWTPGLKRQAADRAYRSGQLRDVIVIVPRVANTIDDQKSALLGSKREIEEAVVEANRTEVAA